MKTLTNKVALVTGASSGIGRATALALGKAGASVVIGNRREAEGEETARLIRDAGGEVVFIKTDVTRQSDVDAIIKRAVDEFGGLDIAFNNAGVEGNLGPIVEETDENFDFVFGVNVKGLWRCVRAEAQVMAASGGGVIINNSSVAGRGGYAGLSTYVASKHAVEGLSKSVAVEMAEAGVRVNCVAPGPIQTDMADRITGGEPEPFYEMIPMRRFGAPEDVAAMVLFLASDAAGYITGESYAVDGGMSA